MAQLITPPRPHPAPHKAVARIRAGRAFEMRAKVEIGSGGLLAIGGLVSAILLSTAVLVRVAARPADR